MIFTHARIFSTPDPSSQYDCIRKVNLKFYENVKDVDVNSIFPFLVVAIFDGVVVIGFAVAIFVSSILTSFDVFVISFGVFVVAAVPSFFTLLFEGVAGLLISEDEDDRTASSR